MARENAKAFAIPMLCGIIGVVFAIMLQLLDDAGVIVDEFLSGTITLQEVQVIVIIIWIVVGVLLAATQR